MIDTATIPETQQSLPGEMFEHLRAVATWDLVQRPTGPGTFPARVLAARRTLKQLEHDLSLLPAAPASNSGNTAALLELRANARMMRSAANALAGLGVHLARVH